MLPSVFLVSYESLGSAWDTTKHVTEATRVGGFVLAHGVIARKAWWYSWY